MPGRLRATGSSEATFFGVTLSLLLSAASATSVAAQHLPPQRQAIAGLAPPTAASNAAGLRVITIASPLPYAISMHIVETSNGLILFDALRTRDQSMRHGRVSIEEREAITRDLRFAFPHYRGAALLPPDELTRRGIDAVARRLADKRQPAHPDLESRAPTNLRVGRSNRSGAPFFSITWASLTVLAEALRTASES